MLEYLGKTHKLIRKHEFHADTENKLYDFENSLFLKVQVQQVFTC